MENNGKIFCQGGGCTAKLGAGVLKHVLKKLPANHDENLLVGFQGSDDAAVYKLTDDLAIVQTLDFFPPMVEDPYIFGQIAATNALSDIYAMGGEVKTALNIVCFPESEDLNLLGEILRGGSEKVMEAGGVLAGGHSISDTGIKYGLSVTGIIHPSKVFQNQGCHDGDVLILTKPLGTGIVCTADRMKAAGEVSLAEAMKSMTTLNKYASEILSEYSPSALTDVTGFGLMVHLTEMLGDDYGAVIHTAALPVITGAEALAEEFYITAAGQRNRNFSSERVQFNQVSFGMEEIVFDAQTSGGLLAALPEKKAKEALARISELGLKCGIIGEVNQEGYVYVCE